MRYFFLILVLFSIAALAQQKKTSEKLVITGDFVHIFNPNTTRYQEDTTWYTNDHCFVKGKDGTWHAYGIIGHFPYMPQKLFMTKKKDGLFPIRAGIRKGFSWHL